MRISVFVGSGAPRAGLEGLVETAERAERDGLDGVWYAQLFAEDALTAIAVAGARTDRIELGTAVVPTFTRHPWVMAQQALTTQAATGGRLALGIGLSHRVTIEDNFGLSFTRVAEHAEEYLTVVRELAHSGSVDFSGKRYRVSGTMDVAGVSPPPILAAALGPRMLEVAGRLADGTITWMVGPRTLEGHVVPGISDSARRAGRPAPRICAGVPLAVADDRGEALAEAARRFSGFASLPSYRAMLDIEGAGGPEEVAVVGSEAEVERELRRYADAGATDILATIFPVGPPGPSIERTWGVLASLVGRI